MGIPKYSYHKMLLIQPEVDHIVLLKQHFYIPLCILLPIKYFKI